MKGYSRFTLTILLALAFATFAVAQTETKDNQPESAQTTSPASQVQAATKMTARLESTLDARTAKPGDEVTARVTKDIKQDGRTVIRKVDRLLGSVASTGASGNTNSRSSVAVEFDRLIQGQTTSTLHTVISAVLSTPADQRAAFDRPASEPAMASPPPTRSSGSAGGSGGLLGRVTSTVGSTVGATAGVTGSVMGGIGGRMGATTQNTAASAAGISLATPARSVQLGSEGRASQATSLQSVLSTDQGQLRLESGTMIEFLVASGEDADSGQKAE